MRTKETLKKILAAREKKNEGLKHASFEMETSTHFSILMKLVSLTKGPILEVGSGLFSTPLLHWLCFENKRPLFTIERHAHYMDFAEKFRTDFHEVLHVKQIENHNFDQYFSIVFIDHTPKKPRTRGDDALLFKDKADFIVLHDCGEDSNDKYGYKQLFSQFKYHYHWTGCYPHTTVLSNTVDIKKLCENSQS